MRVKRRTRPAPEPEQQAKEPLVAWVAWGEPQVELVKVNGRVWPIPLRPLP